MMMKGNDVKPDQVACAEARRALLEKYLCGEIPREETQQHIAKEQWVDSKASDGQVVILRESKGRPPFFFLHGDWTGNAFYCFLLAERLEKDQPFYALEPFSFENMWALPSLEEIAAFHLKTIRAIQQDGPYMLGGFCNGGLVAYEMARQLQRDGQKVDLLILMDAIPARLRLFCRVIRWWGRVLHAEEKEQLTWFLRIQHLYRYIRDRDAEDFIYLRTVDARVDTAFPPIETLRKEYPAMFTWATSQYRPDFYPGKVTLFWDEAEPVRRTWWQRMAKGKDREIEVHIIPGTHYTCKLQQPNGMAEHLNICISLVRGRML